MTDATKIAFHDAILIAFGANLPSEFGEPRATLEAAGDLLAERGVSPIARSRWWRSPAWPEGVGEPDYVNGVARVAYDGGPEALMATLHEVEAALGRERARLWAGRVADLDLIAHGRELRGRGAADPREVAGSPVRARPLALPHPRIAERGFVLLPLAEVAPGWRHPRTGASVEAMIQALPSTHGTTPIS